MLAVVTRHGVDTQEPDPEVPESPSTPLHPSRSTLGRRKEKEKVDQPAIKVEVKEELFSDEEEEEEEEEFFTPPLTPTVPPENVPSPELVSSSPKIRENAPKSRIGQGAAPKVVPPSHPAPLTFTFKAQRDAGMAGPPPGAPPPCPPEPLPQPVPKRERRHRPDEAAAIPEGPAHALPPLTQDPGLIFDLEWDAWYKKCPKWKTAFEKIQNEEDWPEGYQYLDGKLYFENKLCIPLGMTRDVVRAHHKAVGHVGGTRLIQQMARFYQWASGERAKRYAKDMQKQCVICQAMEHAHHALDLRQNPTHVPPVLMDSVAVDVFNMPQVSFEGATYDCYVACVDRMSGWIIAIPCMRKGLQAKNIARQMFHKAWSLFGIPSVITSDQGPQFASAWWQTLCGCLGIRQAFAQAYHHQANGRAEVAGKELQRKLRVLHEEVPGLTWVEALPIAIQKIHDSPGEGGLSPYEIVTGRTRNLAGVPLPVTREAQDAIDFLQKQDCIGAQVADILNDRHARNAIRLNAQKPELEEFKIGDLVWFRRPPSLTADKALPRWVGPCPVVGRTGQRSYRVEIKPGVLQSAFRNQLKRFRNDTPEGESFPLHFFRLTPQEEFGHEDEWQVEKILRHKISKNGMVFFTKWEGYPVSEATWEPVNHFFHRYSAPFVEYCLSNGLQDRVDVLSHLSKRPRRA